MMSLQDALTAQNRWGIVLSGGNGLRLRELVYHRRFDHLPKQYVNFIGQRSMLEHTFNRAERLISREKLLTVIAKEHLQFEEVRHQIAARPTNSVIVQPQNKDTGPGILLSLLHIHRQAPGAAVAVFPSDHFVLEEALFMRYVERAFQIIESDASRIVLLALAPATPDPEYGYLIPGAELDQADSARHVEIFVEKPSAEAARKIIARGALWNTMVMIFSCRTLLSAIRCAAPPLWQSFELIREAIGTAEEPQALELIYRSLTSVNFSKSVLQALPQANRRSLLMLPVRGVTWSDWGTPERLTKSLRELRAPEIRFRAASAGDDMLASPSDLAVAAKARDRRLSPPGA